MLCEASARGNVKRMRLMHDYGQRTDKADYVNVHALIHLDPLYLEVLQTLSLSTAASGFTLPAFFDVHASERH
jgi:hypothetical protein